MADALTRYIYDSGVVAAGLEDGSPILSSLRTEEPKTNTASRWRDWFATWNPEKRREVLLRLHICDNVWYEGDSLPPLDLEKTLGQPSSSETRRLVGSVNASLYFIEAALTHLRSLLKEYAKLTTVVGPSLPFNESSAHLVFGVRSPECYAKFDACLVALRSFCDSLRFTTWQALGRTQGVPRSLKTLARSELPGSLHHCLSKFLEDAFREISEYRDNAVHYAPLAVRDNTRLIYSQKIIHAEIWLPTNPDVRTHDRFEYAQKDAYRTARRLVERTIEFADDFYAEVGLIVRNGNDGEMLG